MKHSWGNSIVTAAALLLLVACSEPTSSDWIGYVEGEDALVAPPQAGWVTSIAVVRGQEVKVGDLLFVLDDTKEKAAHDAAAAAVVAAEAQNFAAGVDIDQAQKELTRQRALANNGASPRRDLELALSAYNGARARRDQAQAEKTRALAELAAADWNLSERAVHARVAGRVENIFFRSGEYAAAMAPVIAILPPSNVFVRFFVPEKEVANLKQGAKVLIGCDGCTEDLKASVSFIAQSAEFTPPIIYSLENRDRLVFKAEAYFEPGQQSDLRPGLPVDVRLDQ